MINNLLAGKGELHSATVDGAKLQKYQMLHLVH